jgi:hypothetical protein
LERQEANTKASRGEVTGRTNNCTAEPSRAQAERQVTNTNAFRGEAAGRTYNYIAEPSGASARAPYCQLERTVSPPGGGKVKLYSEIVEGRTRPKKYKLTVTSKDNQTADKIKEMLKSNINPTEIKLGIGSLKTLRGGRVQIETGSIQEAETLTNNIKDKLGDRMKTNIQRPRKPRLKINNIPEDIATDHIEDILIAQDPDLALKKGKSFLNSIETKKRTRNIVIEVNSHTRKKLIQKKVKLGWIKYSMGDYLDYLVATRCFGCSRFNHRIKDCRGSETCPLCAGNPNLKDCKAQPVDFKCINCWTYNHHNKNTKIKENHSALDRKCPSMQAIIEKYKRNTDY